MFEINIVILFSVGINIIKCNTLNKCNGGNSITSQFCVLGVAFFLTKNTSTQYIIHITHMIF